MGKELKLIEGKNGKGSVVLVNPSGGPIFRLKPNETFGGVYALDEGLVHSVVLDDLYTRKDKEREALPNCYRRRGRSIELVIPKAYAVDGFEDIPFYVVSFKGAGAIPEDGSSAEYIIDPVNWRSNGFAAVGQFGRNWGGLDGRFARGEAENDTLSSVGIFHTPYVAQNKIPLNIQEEIYRKNGRERKPSDKDLYQIVRLSMTNIRYDDFCRFSDAEKKLFVELSWQAGWTPEEWAKHLGLIDGKLVAESLKLERERRFFNFVPKGLMDDNRYISGEITDLEQVTISRYGEESNFWPWPMAVMCQSKAFLKRVAQDLGKNPQQSIDLYFEMISEVTGFRFSGGHRGKENEPMHQNHVLEYDTYRDEMRK